MKDEMKEILRSSLLGAVGLIWVIGGATVVWNAFGIHWLFGWGALFVWIWGCWAGVLYFDLLRFVKIDT